MTKLERSPNCDLPPGTFDAATITNSLKVHGVLLEHSTHFKFVDGLARFGFELLNAEKGKTLVQHLNGDEKILEIDVAISAHKHE